MSAVHDEPTLRVAPAATTVRTSIPMPPRRSALPLILVILAVCLVTLGGIAAVMLWPRKAEEPVVAPSTTTVAEASVTVTAAPAPAPAPTTTTLPRPAQATREEPAPESRPVEPQPEPVREPERKPEPPTREPEPEPQPVTPPKPAPASNVPAFVDGGGDEDTNERMLDQLRRELAGVRRVELHGGAMQTELAKAFKEQFPSVEIGEGAPVVIRFDGTLERLGRGRKRRAAHATISKNGRVIFRYELPDEVFRVGMHPPEAFVNVLSDAIENE